MPSTILSDNGVSSGSAGLKTTAASDGILALQTTTAGGTATTAVTIDTSQNVGVGTASPAYKLDVAGTANTAVVNTTLAYGTSGEVYSSFRFSNSSFSGGNSEIRNIVNGAGSTGSALALFTTQTGTSTLTERLRIDNQGNMGLGVVPNSWAGGFRSLSMSYGGIAATTAGSANTEVVHNAFYNGTNWIAQYTGGYGTRYAAGDSGHAWHTSSTTTTGGSAITFTQAMTLDVSGNLLFRTTSSGSGNTGWAFLATANSNFITTVCGSLIDGATHLSFQTAGVQKGYIAVSGGSTIYSTSSDYRLKENIAPMTGALNKVMQLKPVTYRWIQEQVDSQGFIAHELQEVVPQCVMGEKDAVDEDGNPVYQGIDTSFLVATLTAAIQELKAEFDAYKATHP